MPSLTPGYKTKGFDLLIMDYKIIINRRLSKGETSTGFTIISTESVVKTELIGRQTPASTLARKAVDPVFGDPGA
jgi:hypothetical protein